MGSSLFARHYSGSRGFFPFLWVLRCFSSPACLAHPMYSGTRPSALPLVGFPIRRSRGQRSVSTSPGLIAAAHVLLRLLAPRHPPCALSLLIVKNSYIRSYGVFKVRASQRPPNREEPGCLSRQWPVSQNSTAKRPSTLIVEVDVDLGEPDHGRPESHRRAWQRLRGQVPLRSLERR